MFGDFFTKPLQGTLFGKFCDVILGYNHLSTLVLDNMPTTEEHVGERQTDGGVTAEDALVGSAEVSGDNKQVTWADVEERAQSCQSQSSQMD